ncbi:hypothetical protein N7478_000741 [Penicillium angulare]|uniref:uncharacterized protein n=1 Tax=Penicillium angulare TaxID=116970 RepID=UPI00254005BC|nr:uncharacterized protein N7478_000741 [Penicillium angulare]KAJ5291490.1 hypothetical protein N7478_000741 [Penicillium angulare]
MFSPLELCNALNRVKHQKKSRLASYIDAHSASQPPYHSPSPSPEPPSSRTLELVPGQDTSPTPRKHKPRYLSDQTPLPNLLQTSSRQSLAFIQKLAVVMTLQLHRILFAVGTVLQKRNLIFT